MAGRCGARAIGEERVSDRFAGPGTSASGTAWRRVAQNLIAATEDGTVFVKDMAYPVSPASTGSSSEPSETPSSFDTPL